MITVWVVLAFLYRGADLLNNVAAPSVKHSIEPSESPERGVHSHPKFSLTIILDIFVRVKVTFYQVVKSSTESSATKLENFNALVVNQKPDLSAKFPIDWPNTGYGLSQNEFALNFPTLRPLHVYSRKHLSKTSWPAIYMYVLHYNIHLLCNATNTN